MDINKAYKTLEKFFSREFIEGRETRYVIETAEESWMMPLAWLYAATACARDNDKDEFKRCIQEAKRFYEEHAARDGVSERLLEETEAAETLCDDIDEAFELVKKGL